MKKVAINIIANFTGKIFVALLAILLVPVYIRYLGMESYGLVGFYTTLINAVGILDLGLSTTLNREIARAKAVDTDTKTLRDLVFSMECIYWVIGLVVCAIIVVLSGFIASDWLKAEHIGYGTMRTSIMLMGFVVAVQWPLGFYHGGFMGLERQVEYNIITVVMMALRSLGAVAVLRFVSSTIEAFFIWQVAVNLVYVLWLRLSMWKYLSAVKIKPVFSWIELKKIWRFAAGMTGTAIVTFFLTQADKIVLSKILSLKDFAYYSLAFTVSSSLAIFIMPVTTAIFPKLSGLFAKGNEQGLTRIYHLSSRLVATIIIPVCLTIIFFTNEILQTWLKDANIVRHTVGLTKWLVMGSLFNALMMTPYLLTLAKGWTKFAFYQNLIAVIILFPTMIWLTYLYGGIGAAIVWLIVNAGALVISVPIIHNRILKGQTQHWYLKDNLVPLLFSLAIVMLCYYAYSIFFAGHVFTYFGIAILFSFTVGVTFLQFPDLKSFLLDIVKNKNKITDAG
jgi:O-antigen/teichoic acid export membrane protein